jgi:hypothetical protein
MRFRKENLDAAFEYLAQAGFLARQNFMCCSNCAGYALCSEAEVLVDAGTPPNGAVFYHAQDAEVFGYPDSNEDEDDGFFPEARRSGPLMIRFSGFDTTKHGWVGLQTVQVGQTVEAVFTRFEVPFTWDGTPDSCIEVNVE